MRNLGLLRLRITGWHHAGRAWLSKAIRRSRQKAAQAAGQRNATGAGRLILVVGSQKIVRDLDEAMRRIREHAFPYEDTQVREQLGMGSFIGKVLIISREVARGADDGDPGQATGRYLAEAVRAQAPRCPGQR